MDRQDNNITVLALCAGTDRERKDALATVIFDQYGPSIREAIRLKLVKHRVVRNLDEIVGDIFQNLLLAILKAAEGGQLESVRSLRKYLFGMAKKLTLLYIRGDTRYNERIEEFKTPLERANQVISKAGLSEIETAELESALIECMDKLPPKQKEIMRARYDEFDSPPEPDELADRFSVAPETIRFHLHEARKKMYDCLRRKGMSIPSRKGGLK